MPEFVLPRTNGVFSSSVPIPGPNENVFTSTFGALLPAAKFLKIENGKAAYYEILPRSGGTESQLTNPDCVLFIHGVQTPALGMLPLATALHSSFPDSHFVLLDLWGHGLSDTPVMPHNAGLFHGLIDALLQELNWSSAHLVGFSFGGSLTVGYTASRPSKVQSFVLVAPAGLIRLAGFSPEQQKLLRDTDIDEGEARRFVLGVLEGGELVVPEDWKERVDKGEIVAEALRHWQMKKHHGHVASVVAIFRDGGVMDNDAAFVGAVKTGIPSIVVLGALDDLCTEKELREFGFSTVKVIDHAGHGVVRERAAEVAAYVKEFWASLRDNK